MGYYIRILGIQDPNISISEISVAIEKEKQKATLSIDETEGPNSWSVLLISNDYGVELAQVERNPVIDGEGFSNEDGYHILWQFSDNVTGDWHCAVLNEANIWGRFTIDLGSINQRHEFWAGKVPSSAKRI